jgi:transcriptional regulator with XRE-family HTH domain
MKIKEYLKEKGISVAKFSEISGIPAPSMSAYVYGTRIPNRSNMEKIRQLTDQKVQPNDFY